MDFEAILEAMQPPPGPPRLGGHSPVYEAMWEWFDRLTEHLDPPRRPDWQRMSTILEGKGFLTADGNKPSAERVRKTWWKVRRDKEAQASGTARRPRGRPAAVSKPDKAERAAPNPTPDDQAANDGLTFAGGPKKWKENDT